MFEGSGEFAALASDSPIAHRLVNEKVE